MKAKLDIHNISIKCEKCKSGDMVKMIIGGKQMFECLNVACSEYEKKYEYIPIEIELKEVT